MTSCREIVEFVRVLILQSFEEKFDLDMIAKHRFLTHRVQVVDYGEKNEIQQASDESPDWQVKPNIPINSFTGRLEFLKSQQNQNKQFQEENPDIQKRLNLYFPTESD